MDAVNSSAFHLFKNPRACRAMPYEADGRADILSAARSRLWLGPDSVVLLFGTKGATGKKMYQQIFGRSADQVHASIAA